MNTFKNELKSNFTQIPNALIQDELLSWKAKGIFCYLASKNDDWDFYVDEIQSKSKDGRTALRAGIKELLSAGYLARKNRLEHGKIIGMDWILKDKTRPTENPSDGKPVGQETRRHSNTNNNNTNNNNIEKEIEFEKFWVLYDKKVGRDKSEKKFYRLTETEKDLIFKNLPEYISANPNKQFRKNPLTYLNGKSWNDEIIKEGEQGEIPKNLFTWLSGVDKNLYVRKYQKRFRGKIKHFDSLVGGFNEHCLTKIYAGEINLEKYDVLRELVYYTENKLKYEPAKYSTAPAHKQIGI